MVTKLLYSEKNEYEEVIMEIFSVNDEKFRKYGKVWNNIECTKLIKGMEHTASGGCYLCAVSRGA